MRHIGPFVDRPTTAPATRCSGRSRGGAARASPATCAPSRGQDLFRQLAATADVVCENFRPGTMERWHIGPDDCGPELVWVRVVDLRPGRAQRRPARARPARHRLRRAAAPHRRARPPAGPARRHHLRLPHRRVRGHGRHRRPLPPRHRPRAPAESGGRRRRPGAVIDAALYGSILRVLEWTIAGYDQLGVVRDRQGNRLDNSAPLDNYPTADGAYVCIVAGSDANFRRLCTAMERPDLADDAGLVDAGQAGGPSRRDQRHRGRLDLVADRGRGRGRLHRLRRAGRPRLHRRRHDRPTRTSPPEGPGHHRRSRRRAPPPAGALPAPRRSASDRPSRHPALGPDNDEVWGGLVGLTPDEIDTHRAPG